MQGSARSRLNAPWGCPTGKLSPLSTGRAGAASTPGHDRFGGGSGQELDRPDLEPERARLAVGEHETELANVSGYQRPGLRHAASAEHRFERAEGEFDRLPRAGGFERCAPGDAVEAAVLAQAKLVAATVAP